MPSPIVPRIHAPLTHTPEQVVVPRRVPRRKITVGGKEMTAFDAHRLLEQEISLPRPGQPY